MSVNNRLKSRNLAAGGSSSMLNESNRQNSTSAALNKLNTTINNLKTNTLPKAEIRIKEKLDEMTPVLTHAQLRNLDMHKYAATGNTLLDPLFQVYWRWLVEQIPLNIAPNLLTVIGLILNVITSTIIMIYSPNCDSDVNKIEFFFKFLLLMLSFAVLTLDLANLVRFCRNLLL
jgi:hypothetical protein